MAEDKNAPTTQDEKPQSGTLLEQATAAHKKGQRESALAKVKDLVSKRNEHMKALRLIDAEIADVQAKFDAGIL